MKSRVRSRLYRLYPSIVDPSHQKQAPRAMVGGVGAEGS
jgi:hypothetical protein